MNHGDSERLQRPVVRSTENTPLLHQMGIEATLMLKPPLSTSRHERRTDSTLMTKAVRTRVLMHQ